MTSKKEQAEILSVMEDLVAASLLDSDLDPLVYVRDKVGEMLHISPEEEKYLEAHGRAVTEFPADDSYADLWDLYDMSEKGFTVMISQVRDLAMQDEDNHNPAVMEAWLQGYMVGVYMERSTQRKLKENDA